MSSRRVSVNYDEKADVLYAFFEGARATDSGEGIDGYLILSRDAARDIVGATLISASEMPSDVWRSHPDRGRLPDEIAGAIDEWLCVPHVEE